MNVDVVPYGGWRRNVRLANGVVEAIVTLDVGPRVIRCGFVGGSNVFHEYAEQLGGTGEARWMARGGHRLWVAPEEPGRTYAPDNAPVRCDVDGATVRVGGDADAWGVRKRLDVTLAADAPVVTVVHHVENAAERPTVLAPWALSVMAPGGTEVVPLPPKRPHPGAPENARHASDFWPTQQLVLWPFLDLRDPRLRLGSRCIAVRHDAGRGPLKLGLAHGGWVAYWNAGVVFAKRVVHEDGAVYPDRGASFETFADASMVEIESLGPLVTLAPGASVAHLETWALRRDVAAPAWDDEDALLAILDAR